MLQLFKKYIHTIAGILVVHLLFYNIGPAAGAVSYADVTNLYTAAYPKPQFENVSHSQKIARIKFPNEHRKYGLNEASIALAEFEEALIYYNTDNTFFKRNSQKKISSTCFSLALLRAPPLA